MPNRAASTPEVSGNSAQKKGAPSDLATNRRGLTAQLWGRETMKKAAPWGGLPTLHT